MIDYNVITSESPAEVLGSVATELPQKECYRKGSEIGHSARNSPKLLIN